MKASRGATLEYLLGFFHVSCPAVSKLAALGCCPRTEVGKVGLLVVVIEG